MSVDFLLDSPSFRLSSLSSDAYFDFVYQSFLEVSPQGQTVKQYPIAQFSHTYANSTREIIVNATSSAQGSILVQRGVFQGQLPNGAVLFFDYVWIDCLSVCAHDEILLDCLANSSLPVTFPLEVSGRSNGELSLIFFITIFLYLFFKCIIIYIIIVFVGFVLYLLIVSANETVRISLTRGYPAFYFSFNVSGWIFESPENVCLNDCLIDGLTCRALSLAQPWH
jgi:hypothetical protein